MPSLKVLLSAEQIHNRIAELGAEIDRDYPSGEPVYLIAVLKGAFIFMADLSRAMKTPARIEFIGISSYGKGKTSSGQVQLTKDLDAPIEGHHVIIVEDILDTGITLNYLTKLMAQRKPKSLRIVSVARQAGAAQEPREGGLRRVHDSGRVRGRLRPRLRGGLPEFEGRVRDGGVRTR